MTVKQFTSDLFEKLKLKYPGYSIKRSQESDTAFYGLGFYISLNKRKNADSVFKAKSDAYYLVIKSKVFANKQFSKMYKLSYNSLPYAKKYDITDRFGRLKPILINLDSSYSIDKVYNAIDETLKKTENTIENFKQSQSQQKQKYDVKKQDWLNAGFTVKRGGKNYSDLTISNDYDDYKIVTYVTDKGNIMHTELIVNHKTKIKPTVEFFNDLKKVMNKHLK